MRRKKHITELPLDAACSNASAQMIESHLPQCDECSKIYQAMKTDHYENILQLEKDDVIAHHAKTQARKTMIVGASIAGILCIPVIVCLIVNLAVGHALSWFFIVLSSLIVFASLTVVPLVVVRQKGLCTDTVLFTAMMFCIGFYNNVLLYWKYMPSITLFNVGFIWSIFLICRYLKTDRFIRAGISSIITGGYIFSTDHFISIILGDKRPWPKMNLGAWSPGTVDGNMKWMALLISIFAGLVCIVIGIMHTRQENSK